MNQALGFALIPEKKARDYVVRLNFVINKTYPSEFMLTNGPNLLPHVSMFQGQFPENRVHDVYNAAKEFYSRHTDKITSKTAGLNLWATKIFFLDLEKYKLQEMQDDAFHTFNDMRNQEAGSADPQAFVGITRHEAESFKKYGYPFALEAYRPHFTVGRSDPPTGNEHDFAKKTVMELPLPESITFDRFVVFNVGKFGRLEGIVKEFPLF